MFAAFERKLDLMLWEIVEIRQNLRTLNERMETLMPVLDDLQAAVNAQADAETLLTSAALALTTVVDNVVAFLGNNPAPAQNQLKAITDQLTAETATVKDAVSAITSGDTKLTNLLPPAAPAGGTGAGSTGAGSTGTSATGTGAASIGGASTTAAGGTSAAGATGGTGASGAAAGAGTIAGS